MNIARVVEVDDAPTLLIYAKTHGTHTHTDVDGITEHESGNCSSRRFERELMPKPGEETTVWLITKVQNFLGATIEARPWAGGIDIMRVTKPTTTPQVASAA